MRPALPPPRRRSEPEVYVTPACPMATLPSEQRGVPLPPRPEADVHKRLAAMVAGRDLATVTGLLPWSPESDALAAEAWRELRGDVATARPPRVQSGVFEVAMPAQRAATGGVK